jgi:hypothetical protein
MAKRNLDRNLPAKKYTHSNPTELKLAFEFSGGATEFIDIARAMSAVNRKFVSQQAYFYVSKIELFNNSDSFVDIHTLPDNWVTRNAYKRGRAMFEKMNGLLDPAVSGIAAAPYYDFKVYMSNRHRTRGSANPVLYDINADAVSGYAPVVPDEWGYNQLISADDDGDATQQADNFYLHMIGDHVGSSDNWVSVGLIKSYAESRTTVSGSGGGSDVVLDLADPIMNLMDNSSEEQINDVAQRLQFDNDAPPYDLDLYPGSVNEGMVNQCRLVTTSTLGRVTSAPGFCAPLGLICVDSRNVANDAYRIVITLAPGTYHGTYAERV